MEDIQRTFNEVIAKYELEPELKDVYVEGLDDKYLIEDFLAFVDVADISVYEIDSIDYNDVYKQLSEEQREELSNNNKKRVVYLANELNRIYNPLHLTVLCIVDIDNDFLFERDVRNDMLLYTDFNSMDMYLFKDTTISGFMKKAVRIRKINNIEGVMNSIADVSRQLFFIDYIRQKYKPSAKSVDNDKDFSVNKDMELALNFESYWRKTIQKAGLTAVEHECKADFDSKYNDHTRDIRLEMRGHDFVWCFYTLLSKARKSFGMSEDMFANVLWEYADMDYLSRQPLFQCLMGL